MQLKGMLLVMSYEWDEATRITAGHRLKPAISVRTRRNTFQKKFRRKLFAKCS